MEDSSLIVQNDEEAFCIYGRKIMIPNIAEVTAATSTAPAEISLASFAHGCSLSVNASTTASIAVFVNSTEMTNPMRNIIIIQSVLEILKMTPAIITSTPKRKWNFKFGSSFKAVTIPVSAYLKDRILRLG